MKEQKIHERHLKESLRDFFKRSRGAVWQMSTFILLLLLYIFEKINYKLTHIKKFSKLTFLGSNPQAQRLFAPFNKAYRRLILYLDPKDNRSISRTDLIDLALRNMQTKRTRSIVTIGGMTIGIAAIVFLVSIGYGLEQLVITRVARLEEMRQADVSPQTGGKVKITDKTISDLKNIKNVDLALPLIAVVGRVNYKNSVSDIAAYGVTSDYLKQSAIKPVGGAIFDSNEISYILDSGKVAGISTEYSYGVIKEKIQDVIYNFPHGEWLKVRSDPSIKANVVGFTKRVEGETTGQEIWGGSYASQNGLGEAGTDINGDSLGKWLSSRFPIWEKAPCDSKASVDCIDGDYQIVKDESGQQLYREGYVAEVDVSITAQNISTPQVLGLTLNTEEASKAADAIATIVTNNNANSNVDWIEIASESGNLVSENKKIVELPATAKKQVVVNRAMLKVLGLKETEAIGKPITVSLIVVGDLLADPSEKIESAPADYTIVGVTPDDKTPVFYVPFIDVRALGVVNYSQLKVVVKNKNDLAGVRRQIESMGYTTRSVEDTVAQITNLFSTARTILALLGMVALSVAALGMFNTLTVSLLERTREVGLMKAMGMKSSEVRELFLTESMIMGFFGGMLGVLIGFIGGKLLGLLLSVFAIFSGVGFVDISFIPVSFVLLVVFLSLMVGIITGIYPARRATKISALNALRYE